MTEYRLKFWKFKQERVGHHVQIEILKVRNDLRITPLWNPTPTDLIMCRPPIDLLEVLVQ